MAADDGQVEEDPAAEGHHGCQVEFGNADHPPEPDKADGEDHVHHEAAEEHVAAESPLGAGPHPAEHRIQRRQHRQRERFLGTQINPFAPDKQRPGEAGDEAQDWPPCPKVS